MDVVEIRIVQIAKVVASHATRKRFHLDFLPLREDAAERLQLDETAAEVDDSLMAFGGNVANRSTI